MAHSYTVIFEKEVEGGYHVFVRLCQDAIHRARPSKKESRIFAKRSDSTSRAWWRMVCHSHRRYPDQAD